MKYVRPVRFLQCALVAALAGAASPAFASINVLANPSFELPALAGGDISGSPGWDVYGGGHFTLASNIGVPAHEGTQVMKTFGFSGLFQTFPVNAGESVSASAWMLNWSNDAVQPTNTVAFAQLLVIYLDSSSTQVGSTLVGSFMQPVPTVDVWINQTIDSIAPAGATQVRFQLNTGNPQGGAIMYDDASLIITPAPGATGLLAAAGILASRRRRR